MQTAIIVPCYNESNRLDLHSFGEFIERNENYYFHFVNDGSEDNTQDVLTQFQKKFTKNVFILALNSNFGKAEAVRRGVLEAHSLCTYELIGFLDADLATPLEELHLLKKPFVDKDIAIVIGSRIKRLGATIQRSSKRHYLGRIFATISSVLLKLPVYDTQCGAKLFRACTINILFDQPFTSKWLFDVEILSRFKSASEFNNSKIEEVPLRQWIAKDGTKIKLKDFLQVPWELYKIQKGLTK